LPLKQKTLENQMINKGLSTLYGAIFESDIIYLNKNLKVIGFS